MKDLAEGISKTTLFTTFLEVPLKNTESSSNLKRSTFPGRNKMSESVRELVGFIYGPEKEEAVCSSLLERVKKRVARITAPPTRGEGSLPLDEADSFMITYGDQFRRPGTLPLECLKEFCEEKLTGVLSGVHILPFFPYTSDDGFSIADYTKVHPDWGGWKQVSGIGTSFKLMSDLVLNHCSASHRWFKGFLEDDPRYRDFFISVDPDTDLSTIVRPRALPLLTPFETAAGTKHVWTTFSADQVDLNFACPDVLIEMIDVFLFHVQMGVQVIRLDAIAYLWKEIGHPSIHHPKTHAVVRLFRAIVEEYVPWVIILTETNVPHKENISYFGTGDDEAHMIYQFSLPPLTLDAFRREDAGHLRDWAATLPPVDGRTTYFNFLASHDGVGVTPAHGILSDQELEGLIRSVEERGGLVSYKAVKEGKVPYELNINYRDAVAGDQTEPRQTAAQFIAAQSILLAMPGVPGIYVHSLIGSGNWSEGVKETGMNRTINRRKLQLDQVLQELSDPASLEARIFKGYTNMLKVRRERPAFHPASPFLVLKADGPVFGLLRGDEERGRVVCLVNSSSRPAQWKVDPAAKLKGVLTDCINGGSFTVAAGSITLEPFQVLWLETMT
jgi:glucosylglycerate phosphorylase